MFRNFFLVNAMHRNEISQRDGYPLGDETWAGPLVRGAMTAFRLATAGDDDRLRWLLRDNGMPGWVEMCIEREPSYFAGQDWFGHDWAVLAEEGGDLVGMYAASVLPLCVNGAVEDVGYLGGLRVQAAHRRRIRHLREGYASIRRLAPDSDHGTLVVHGGRGRQRRRAAPARSRRARPAEVPGHRQLRHLRGGRRAGPIERAVAPSATGRVAHRYWLGTGSLRCASN